MKSANVRFILERLHRKKVTRGQRTTHDTHPELIASQRKTKPEKKLLAVGPEAKLSWVETVVCAVHTKVHRMILSRSCGKNR